MDFEKLKHIIGNEDLFYESNRALLYCGNSLEIMKKIPKDTFDVCFTDPPYNISGYNGKGKIGWLNSNDYWIKKKKYNNINENWDKFEDEFYITFTKKWIDQITRIVKPNGNIIIFGTYHNIYTIGFLLKKKELKIVNSIIWYKRNAFPNITQRMFCESTEQLIWAVNEKTKNAKNWTFNYKIAKELNKQKYCEKCKKGWDESYKYCPVCGKEINKIVTKQMRNMWDIPNTPNKEKKHGKHPSQKPIEVIKKIILSLTNEDDFIIDPFMGTGSIPLVCDLLNRNVIGIEKDKPYCGISRKKFDDKEFYKSNYIKMCR